MELALEMGKTLKQLLRDLDSDEYVLWLAYARNKAKEKKT